MLFLLYHTELVLLQDILKTVCICLDNVQMYLEYIHEDKTDKASLSNTYTENIKMSFQNIIFVLNKTMIEILFQFSKQFARIFYILQRPYITKP